jgi:hypothetical protein
MLRVEVFRSVKMKQIVSWFQQFHRKHRLCLFPSDFHRSSRVFEGENKKEKKIEAK